MTKMRWMVLSVVGMLALGGCSGHHHHYGMEGGKSDAYWQKGQQDMAGLVDRTMKDPAKAAQVKAIVGEIVTELKAGREQERTAHRQLDADQARDLGRPREHEGRANDRQPAQDHDVEHARARAEQAHAADPRELRQPVLGCRVGLLLQRLAFDLAAHQVAVNRIQFLRLAVHLHAQPARRLVHQVDRLVRQEPVRHVARGELCRRLAEAESCLPCGLAARDSPAWLDPRRKKGVIV